jgi:hypothetical protein
MEHNRRDTYTTLAGRIRDILRLSHCSSSGAISKVTVEEQLNIRVVSGDIGVPGVELGCYLEEMWTYILAVCTDCLLWFEK